MLGYSTMSQIEAIAAFVAIGSGLGLSWIPGRRLRRGLFAALLMLPLLAWAILGAGAGCIPAPPGTACYWFGFGTVLLVVYGWPLWIILVAVGIGLRRAWLAIVR